MKNMISAAAIALVLATAGCSSSDEPDEFGAQVMCEDFVKDRLKSPSTADFSDTTRSSSGTNTWTVSGSVDSENSFGAMIRNTYVCEVRYAGDDMWKLVDLQFSEQ